MMTPRRLLLASIVLPAVCFGQEIAVDGSNAFPMTGPVRVEVQSGVLAVRWPDERGRIWTAAFSLDSRKPLIQAISVGGRTVAEGIRPFYQCQTGRRRGGWDAFFDFPPSAPEGTRSFIGEFAPRKVQVTSSGERLSVSFDGMAMGIFRGRIRYLFYPGSRLVEQQAAMVTGQEDVAYIYDAGIRMGAAADQTPGGNMNTEISFFDTKGAFQTVVPPYGSERQTTPVRFRSVAARTAAGSIAVFPAPHQYFFARDYTTNLGYIWYKAWRGTVSLGIRQYPDDDSPYYPWMNAPKGTEQLMKMFFLLDDAPARTILEQVTRYTHGDRFRSLPGYVTFAPHWHLAYTMQARDRPSDYQPSFEPAMKAAGINAAMIMDFHGDGHPQDTGQTRLEELRDYFRACRARSGKDFLLIPAEEANVILGGHWAVVFPKPVYWMMSRKEKEPFLSQDPKSGAVYRVGNAEEVMNMVHREHGWLYQTHPRTKGSTGYPAAIRGTAFFRDPSYLGAGWKAMPSDLSLPRLGDRAFKTIDDLNNEGLRKRMLGEVDVFQLDPTHELYGHLNVNYVKLDSLPSYDGYGKLLDAVAKGDYFISTGEIVFPEWQLSGFGDDVSADVTVEHTFPLELAEVVWGDGAATHRETIPLHDTREFGRKRYVWTVKTPGWKWARLAVWDVAADGAFTNPVWR